MLIEVGSHQTGWRADFQQAGRLVRAALGQRASRIDHIGSTSVPGLAAKPIIDMQLTLETLADVTSVCDALLELGYDHRSQITCDRPPEWDNSGSEQWQKAYFRRTHPDAPRVHLHVREAGRRNQRYALLMRDYLRADAQARDSYALFKRRLSRAVGSVSDPGGTGPYLDLKDPFFDLLASNAEVWAKQCHWVPAPSDL